MRWSWMLVVATLLAACGDDDAVTAQSAVLPTVAETSDIRIASTGQLTTPYIHRLNLVGQRLPALKTLTYTIAPKPGSASKPVRVTHTLAALRDGGRFPTSRELALPVFGLYAGYDNQVSVTIGFADASVQRLDVTISTTTPTQLHPAYAAPVRIMPRAPGRALGFDFFLVKSNVGSPLIIDTDGEVRWMATGVPTGFASMMRGNSIVIGDRAAPLVHHLELDGSVSTAPLMNPTFTQFHHNVDAGRTAFLGEFDTADDIESIIAEFEVDGSILKEWHFATIFSDYMSAQGDDPAAFVRREVDWFHTNAATYDPRDDSLLVSAREHFVVKVDYDTGEILWLFGDPTKHWASFPSLRAKALTLAPGGLYPIGQHATSITQDGLLMLFNNGYASLNQPAGAPAGANRAYSAVSAYRIDEVNRTATEEWRFEYAQSILSLVCSSVYEAPDRSLLISYAYADNGNRARIVGLDPDRQVVFDLQYENNRTGCGISWNAVPVALDAVSYE
jgi:arylsulfate sulfotransferase